ncbi:MAG: cob(I)yrinic acid a,c-diamide adenosyltransferase [Pseudomonadota bacterium]
MSDDTKPRINNVTTRGGDRGETSLATGRRLPKSHQLFRVIGAVDELNSHIGVLRNQTDLYADEMQNLQQSLFDIGAVFALEGGTEEYSPTLPDIVELEGWVRAGNANLPPLKEFILPRGNAATTAAHVCRTVCRRAEVELWTLLDETPEPPNTYLAVARYLNRLSDLFFVLARLASDDETQWRGPSQA